MRTMGIRYIYHDGAVLESAIMDLSPSFFLVEDEPQKRLLNSLANFSSGGQKMSLVVYTDVDAHGRDGEFSSVRYVPTANCREIVVGKVTRTAHPDTYNSRGVSYGPPFEFEYAPLEGEWWKDVVDHEETREHETMADDEYEKDLPLKWEEMFDENVYFDIEVVRSFVLCGHPHENICRNIQHTHFGTRRTLTNSEPIKQNIPVKKDGYVFA